MSSTGNAGRRSARHRPPGSAQPLEPGGPGDGRHDGPHLGRVFVHESDSPSIQSPPNQAPAQQQPQAQQSPVPAQPNLMDTANVQQAPQASSLATSSNENQSSVSFCVPPTLTKRVVSQLSLTQLTADLQTQQQVLPPSIFHAHVADVTPSAPTAISTSTTTVQVSEAHSVSSSHSGTRGSTPSTPSRRQRAFQEQTASRHMLQQLFSMNPRERTLMAQATIRLTATASEHPTRGRNRGRNSRQGSRIN